MIDRLLQTLIALIIVACVIFIPYYIGLVAGTLLIGPPPAHYQGMCWMIGVIMIFLISVIVSFFKWLITGDGTLI